MQSPQTVSSSNAVFYRNGPLPKNTTEAVEGALRIAVETICVEATEAPQFIDLTAQVEQFIARCGIRDGQVTIHSLHTTAAVVVNEREPLLMEDAARFLEKLAPVDAAYRHDDFTVRTVNMHEGEVANAHAHLQMLLLGATETLPVVAGQIALGQWQRIFMVELDQAKPRSVLLQVMGIAGDS